MTEETPSDGVALGQSADVEQGAVHAISRQR
jgi:hypothetical protein